MVSLSVLTVSPVVAQQLEVSTSLNPVGSGARATGMGGAFIAIADDATAASWNPAGLVHLERPEVSAVYSFLARNQQYSSYTHPELDQSGDQSVSLSSLNYVSGVYPFSLFGMNMVASLNFQRMYDFNKNLSLNYDRSVVSGTVHDNIQFSQQGQMTTITPAFAVQVIPELYVGIAVNLWGDYLGTSNWESTYQSLGVGSLGGMSFANTVTARSKYSMVSGVNTTLGMAWNINPAFTLGAVVKTPFDANVDVDTHYNEISPFVVNGTTASHSSLKLYMPMSYGVGIAYRHSDSFTVALDLYRTEWSRLSMTNAQGTEINPLTTDTIQKGRLKDTIQLRLGAEYLYILDEFVISVRSGFFYDPEPGYRTYRNQDGSNGYEMTTDDYLGFSIGSGISYKNISLDFSYQYRRCPDASGDIPQSGITAGITQHSLMASLICRF